MSVANDAAASTRNDQPRRRRLGNAKAVSELLDLSLPNLYERSRLGKIPGTIRIGKRVLYDLDQIDAWLDAGGDAARERP